MSSVGVHRVRAIVSGATGFLGTALLPRLDGVVHVLLRGGDADTRATRLARTTQAQVVALPGDVLGERWGLESRLEALRGQVDVVANLAAETSWAAPWARLHRVNVLGALHGVDVAAALGVPYLHVSSFFAAYAVDGVVRQALVPEAPWLTDYERSKCRAEWLLDARCRQVGVDCRIVRVGGLSGDSVPPAVGRQRRAAPLAALLREYAPRWIPYAADARCDICPRDLVAAELARLLAEAVPEGSSVVHIGLGDGAMSAGALLHEVRANSRGRWRSVRVPSRALLEASTQANRLRRGHRSAAVIGLRYLASAAVYENGALADEPSLRVVARSLGVPAPTAPAAPGAFYEDW